jgi:hypothetical protein
LRGNRSAIHGCKAALAAASAIACLAAAMPAEAGPQQDCGATYADWKPDGDITACRFSRAELESAYAVATGSPDFRHATASPTS